MPSLRQRKKSFDRAFPADTVMAVLTMTSVDGSQATWPVRWHLLGMITDEAGRQLLDIPEPRLGEGDVSRRYSPPRTFRIHIQQAPEFESPVVIRGFGWPDCIKKEVVKAFFAARAMSRLVAPARTSNEPRPRL